MTMRLGQYGIQPILSEMEDDIWIFKNTFGSAGEPAGSRVWSTKNCKSPKTAIRRFNKKFPEREEAVTLYKVEGGRHIYYQVIYFGLFRK